MDATDSIRIYQNSQIYAGAVINNEKGDCYFKPNESTLMVLSWIVKQYLQIIMEITILR